MAAMVLLVAQSIILLQRLCLSQEDVRKNGGRPERKVNIF